MKSRANNGFVASLATGISDASLIIVTLTAAFLSYHVLLASAAGY